MNTGTVPAEEILKALKEATPGPWEIDEANNVNGPDTGYGEMRVATLYGTARREQTGNAHLIANAPTWLRSLLEENQLAEQTLTVKDDTIKHLDSQLQQLREELERTRVSAKHWQDRYDRDADRLPNAMVEAEFLRSQLAATRYEITEISKEATAGLNGDLERADAGLQRIDLLSKNILATINESKTDTATTTLG